MKEYRGIAVSPGVAIARVFLVDDARLRVPKRQVRAENVPDELVRLDVALEASRGELEELRGQAEAELGDEAASIFAFHRAMLNDPSLTKPMRRMIEDDQFAAEYAVQEASRALGERFASMPDGAFQTKVDDVWDLERRVLRHLIGAHTSALSEEGPPVIVVAKDLTPSDAAAFPRARVHGFATDAGGPTSHTAIFARALEIPAVVGLRRVSEVLEQGDMIVLDGDRGAVICHPDEQTLEQYKGVIETRKTIRASLGEFRDQACQLTDGTTISLLGNVESAQEVEAIDANGGDGVGLFRTEFLWLTSNTEPSEDAQYEQYVAAVHGSKGKPVTIRTFDLGADKYTQARALIPERNPFLGLRSIRYCLQNLRMFRTQLRAILRASAEGPVKMMFPLITNASELRQAQMIVRDVMDELREEGVAFDEEIQIGMMVESPSAAIMPASFAKLVDFFSIGTNDLIQYTLAVDRTNEQVASLYSPGHPAILKLIKGVIRAGRRRGIEVSCCGEVAGDPEYAMLLVGLGLRSLSMTPSRIPYMKQVLRQVALEDCERLARTVGSFDSERRVVAYLRQQAKRIIPESFDGRSVDTHAE